MVSFLCIFYKIHTFWTWCSLGHLTNREWPLGPQFTCLLPNSPAASTFQYCDCPVSYIAHLQWCHCVFIFNIHVFNSLFVQDNLGKLAHRKVNHPGFYWSKRWWGGSGISWTMQIICTTLQTDNHASTPSLNFLRAGCSSWCPTNSVIFNILNLLMPSVLWRCWLGVRKGIRPVKNWVVGCWRGCLHGVQTCI